MPKERDVMVIFGRNKPLTQHVRTMLLRMGLNPLTWNQLVQGAGGGAVHNLEVVRAAFSRVQAVVAILCGEEKVQLRPEFAPDKNLQKGYQPRPNVIFEVGIALQVMPAQTFLLQFSDIRIWSDIDGIYRFNFTKDDIPLRQELFRQLQLAGCAVDTSAIDYLLPDIQLIC